MKHVDIPSAIGDGALPQSRSNSVKQSAFVLACLCPGEDFGRCVALELILYHGNNNLAMADVVVVVVVFTLKAVPVSTQYFLTSVLVQLTRTPSVVTG